MNTILIPVDFSEISRTSVEFARLLSGKLNLDVTLLHIINAPSVAVHSTMVIDADVVEKAREEAENRLKEWCAELTADGVRCSYLLREGFVVDTVVQTEQELQPDLLIMGTTGATGWMGNLIGSNSSAVLSRVKRPVLLIPHDTRVKEFRNILYATQLEMVEAEVLKKVFHWAHAFNGKVDLIKVNTQYQLDIFSDNFIIEELRRLFPQERFAVYTETASNTLKGIDHYLEANSVDLIVMTTSRQSFIERLFNGSVTRKMALHTDIPLLIYHYEE